MTANHGEETAHWSVGGEEVVPLFQASVEMRTNCAALYHRALAGEFRLVRVPNNGWGIRRSELTSAKAEDRAA